MVNKGLFDRIASGLQIFSTPSFRRFSVQLLQIRAACALQGAEAQLYVRAKSSTAWAYEDQLGGWLNKTEANLAVWGMVGLSEASRRGVRRPGLQSAISATLPSIGPRGREKPRASTHTLGKSAQVGSPSKEKKGEGY